MTNKSERVDSKVTAVEFEMEYGEVFNLPEEERVALLDYENKLVNLRPQIVSSYTSLDLLNKVTKERDVKTKSVLDDLREQSDQIRIAQNISILYLTVLEAASESGWSREQAMEVFTKQLEFNTLVSKFTIDLAKKRLTGMYLSDNRKMSVAYARLAKQIPSWYKPSVYEWRNLIFKTFDKQLDLERTLLFGICTSNIGYIEGTYRITSELILPDWIEDKPNSGLPDKEVVEMDLKEDELAKQKLVEQFEYLSDRRSYLTESARQKGRKTISLNTEKYQELFPNNQTSLAQIVMFLGNTDQMTYYNIDPKKINDLSPSQINSNAFSEQSKELFFIRHFAESAEMSEEMVSIFIRKKLDEIKFFEGTPEEKSLKIAALLSAQGITNEMAELRLNDKKSAQRLTFDIRPMMNELNDDNLEILRNKYDGNPFTNQTEFIEDLAEAIASSFWAMSEAKETDKLKVEYKKFVIIWLKNNWRVAYATLYHRLHNSDLFDQQPIDNSVGQAVTTQVTEDFLAIETAITDAKLGSLTDWSVYLDVNKNRDSRMEKLSGESLEELETQLEALIIKHRISCSIKLSSVIHTLEWAAALPQEVLQVMIREVVNGEDYLKIKRGNVRLFFQIDQSQKRLIFFVYQKQALGYSF